MYLLKKGDHTFVIRPFRLRPNKSRRPVFSSESKRTDRSFGANRTADDLYKIGRTEPLYARSTGEYRNDEIIVVTALGRRNRVMR